MLGRSKRILLLSFYYEPDLCAGSFRATAFMDAFKKNDFEDYEVDIVTTMPNRYKTFKAKAKEQEILNNINIYRIPLPPHKSGLFDQIKSFRSYFFKAISITRNREYDLVIATSSRLFTAFLGAVVSRRKKAPLYLDIRDIFTDTMNEVLTNKALKAVVMPFLSFIERFTFNRANHINLVSEGFSHYFKSKYKNNYSFFTNGIDTEFLQYNFEQSKKNKKPVITYAGNIGEGQGLHIIIPQAAKQLEEEFDFKIIGDGGAKEKLVKALSSLSVKNVELVDPVNRNQLKVYYKESDYLFLHLNDFEAFRKVLPSKLFEYGVTNKPIIGGLGGYAALFVEENIHDSIIFEPGDNETMVEKLRAYKLQKFNRTNFIKKYSRVNIMDKMVDQIKNKFLKT